MGFWVASRQRERVGRPAAGIDPVDNLGAWRAGPACGYATNWGGGDLGVAMAQTGITGESRSFIDRYFGLHEHGTSIRTEFVAGLTTFLTMVYIVFVNPTILANAGMDKGAVFVATCIASAVATLVMALYANYPLALGPRMGVYALFSVPRVLGIKFTWPHAAPAGV